jgi:hypothetical protein
MLVEKQQQHRYPSLFVRRDDDAVVVNIPMKLCRRGGQQMILTASGVAPVPNMHSADENTRVNQALIEAIAKGYHWQAQLESGKYPSIEDLAQAVGVERSYIGRMLRLTSLAPDFIEAILCGDQPDGLSRRSRQAKSELSLEKLRKNLPVWWNK